MRRAADALDRAVLALGGVALAVMIVTAAAGVFYRYVLRYSLPWTEEVDAYLFIWLTFLGAAAGLLRGEHPQITVLAERLSVKLRTAVRLLVTAAIVAWGLILFDYGLKLLALMAPVAWSSVPSLSMQGPYAAIPVGGALIVVFAVAWAVLHP